MTTGHRTGGESPMPDQYITEKKLCHTCDQTLPIEAFHRRTNRPSGRASACKNCKRWWRQNTEAGLRWKRASRIQWGRRNPHKMKAHLAVCRAIKAGTLVRTACSTCGSDERVEGHHHNGYESAYVLDVTWLCQPCHRSEHEIMAGKAR